MNKINVLFASSEVVPFAKTGGLADVAGSLPKALVKAGHDVRVVMPRYSSISEKYKSEMEYVTFFNVWVGWRNEPCVVLQIKKDNVIYYFLENERYFNREWLYGYFDQAEQFAFFQFALLELARKLNFKPDILHGNDWQTGMLGIILKEKFKYDDFFKNTKTIYTIHNLKYQGVFAKECLSNLFGLGWEHFTVDKLEFHDQINFMKSALVYYDAITTVSPTYAEEIKSDYFGEGLSEIVRRRANDLYGIINGIDWEDNNPSTDTRIFANFDASKTKGKKDNKRQLQQQLGLPEREDVPIIGIISRLVDQKGFDLIDRVLGDILYEDVQLVILGTGEQKYEDLFRWAAWAYHDKVSANIKYDGTLAQRIYAGCDMFLMPSQFEPCGLSQLFSMRYGTIPIVRETGGLKDTVIPYNEFNGTGNGFTFANYNAHDMLFTIRRALGFYSKKRIWDSLVKKAMMQDFSWEQSATKYVEVYEKLLGSN